jgi:hypothetical protein
MNCLDFSAEISTPQLFAEAAVPLIRRTTSPAFLSASAVIYF